MSMTFVVHLSILAPTEKKEKGHGDRGASEKGRQDTQPLNSNL